MNTVIKMTDGHDMTLNEFGKQIMPGGHREGILIRLLFQSESHCGITVSMVS